ncbi:MAG: hypothetical protein R2864_14830 [Syntrophotaleaceae bacterium]
MLPAPPRSNGVVIEMQADQAIGTAQGFHRQQAAPSRSSIVAPGNFLGSMVMGAAASEESSLTLS